MSFCEPEDNGRERDEHSEAKEDFGEVFEEPRPRGSDGGGDDAEEAKGLGVAFWSGGDDGRRGLRRFGLWRGREGNRRARVFLHPIRPPGLIPA